MRHTVLLIFLMLTISLNVYSQKNIIINLKTGYNVPLADLKGNVYDSSDQVNTYVMNHGYNFGVDIKYGVTKNPNLLAVLGLGYNMFVNTKENVYNMGIDEEYWLNAFVITAGLEYSLLSESKFNPFIGVDFSGHFFNGGREIVGITGYKTKLKLEKAVRYGFAAGLGIEYKVTKGFGIVAGSKYQLANLIGKDSSGISAGKYGLNDQEYLYLNQTVAAKTISYLQLYIGVSFYLRPKKA